MTTRTDDIASWRTPVRATPPTLLEAAVGCRKSGLTHLDGAIVLATRFDPDPHSLATVVAAVWGIGGRPETIDAALRHCDRWSDDAIADAVISTADRYNGILVRTSPSDNGIRPAAVRGVSPDILPAGTQPLPDPASAFGLDWGSAQAHPVIPGAVNYIYVRGRNFFPGPESGSLRLYAVPTPLLMRLSGATELRTPSGAAVVTLNPTRTDEIVVAGEPFLWRAPEDGRPVSLVARIDTPHAPSAPPTDESPAGIIAWVADHPGFAWRSVALLDGGPARERSTTLRIGNPSPTSGRFLVAATCSGFPDGMQIRLRARLSGIDSGVMPLKSSGTIVTALAHIPGWLEEDLVIEITDPEGTRLCTDGAIDIRNYMVVGGESPLPPWLSATESDGIHHAGLIPGDQLGLLGSYRMLFGVPSSSIIFDPFAAQFNTPDRRAESLTAPARRRAPR